MITATILALAFALLALAFAREIATAAATVRKMIAGDRAATAHKPAWNAGPDPATVQKLAINWTVWN